MKKFTIFTSIVILFITIMLVTSNMALYARSDLGFFGGITEGVRLPLTTETIIAENARGANRRNERDFVYKEMIFLAGAPVEFEGNMNRRITGQIAPLGETSGTATVRYLVTPMAGNANTINRDITLNVNWRREGNQIIENYSVASRNNNLQWSETIVVGGTTFTLVPSQSHLNVSILRDVTPGVTYYRGDISKRAVYTTGGENPTTVTKEVMGQIYGFTSAWSAVETQRLNGMIITPTWQMQYQVVPSVSVNKELQYAQAEPTLISFAGNYREVMSNQSGLNYIIHTLPNMFYGTPTFGSATISTFNTFEQLIAPDLGYLRGHWAERDIRRLFSMQILQGNPNHFRPYQGVTRAEFITMLARAVKLPLNPDHMPQNQNNRRRATQIDPVFPDVWQERPDFPYIMAAYEAGIAVGRGEGHFQGDAIIRREEAYVLALRMLGLSNLGLQPTPITPFVDDVDIQNWARSDIYAAARIGLILPDNNGMVHPQEVMTSAQAAALVLRLIDYMRHELAVDYTENIINFLN